MVKNALKPQNAAAAAFWDRDDRCCDGIVLSAGRRCTQWTDQIPVSRSRYFGADRTPDQYNMYQYEVDHVYRVGSV